jgi:hypothetical protein
MKQLLFIGIAVTMIIGCGPNNAGMKETGPNTKSTGDNIITFKINGQQVTTSAWTISRFAWNTSPVHEWLNITSNMKMEKRTINVNLNGAVPGVYELNETGAASEESHGSFFPNYLDDMTNSFSFSEGAFNLTEVDTVHHRVNGTFSGIAKNLKGETIQVTDGQIINGLLNSSIIRY